MILTPVLLVSSVADAVAAVDLAAVRGSRRTRAPRCRSAGSRGLGGSRTGEGSRTCHSIFKK